MREVEGTGTGFGCLWEPFNDELDLCHCSFCKAQKRTYRTFGVTIKCQCGGHGFPGGVGGS